MEDLPQPAVPEPAAPALPESPRPRRTPFLPRAYQALGRIWLILTLLAFGVGAFLGYRSGQHQAQAAAQNTKPHARMDEINPPSGYKLPARYADLGPKLIAAGGIDLQKFIDIYQQAGRPLSDGQKAILTQAVDQEIVISAQNAYFLLNFFWAVGLTNQNPILDTGEMLAQGKDQVGNLASIGGWTLGRSDPVSLYSSAALIPLTAEQQERLEKVTKVVYRPCCNNSTHFPDCNHGMAMLGLLELLASQDASQAQMLEAAKYVNAFWYPQQYLELATAFKATQNVSYAKADAAQLLGSRYSSGSGFQTVHAWLASNNLLPQGTNQGNSCGVQ